MKKIIITTLISLFVFSCEKEYESVFSGITVRDPSGIITGSTDKDDWQIDDIWNDQEEQLFNPLNFKSTEIIYMKTDPFPPIGGIIGSGIMAYPNPASSVFNFEIYSMADTSRFVLVNSNYEIIIARKQNDGNCTVGIITSNRSTFKANSLYRIYYKLEYIDGKIERGHGDIKIID